MRRPRQDVERDQLLGNHDRRTHRDDDDARTDPHACREGADVGKGQDRLEDPPVLVCVRAVDGQVVCRPDACISQSLSRLGGRLDALDG
jgi:hypothetical protein